VGSIFNDFTAGKLSIIVTNKIITSAIPTLLLLTVSTAAAFAQQLPQQQKKGLVVVSLSEIQQAQSIIYRV
jgi:hypothetical protein